MSDQLALLPPAPRVYANGLGVGYSKTECMVTFMFSNEPLVSVILPFPVARSLAENISVMISEFEKRSGKEIPKIESIITDDAPKVEAGK